MLSYLNGQQPKKQYFPKYKQLLQKNDPKPVTEINTKLNIHHIQFKNQYLSINDYRYNIKHSF